MIYKLNNKEYQTKDINFREMVKMEKCGVNIMTLGKDSNLFGQAVCMVSYITGLSKEKSADEIDSHLDNGGTIEEVFKCFEVISTSDFFKKVGVKK